MEDGLILFPDSSDHTNSITDARQVGGHDPICHGESGRQHRPTGSDTALRCSETGENSSTSRSAHVTGVNTEAGSFLEEGLPKG